MSAQRGEVVTGGGSAARVVDRVVLVAASGRGAAAGMHAEAIPDLGVAAQAGPGDAVVGVGVEIGAGRGVTAMVVVAGGDVGDH